jgi:hypothetical protein
MLTNDPAPGLLDDNGGGCGDGGVRRRKEIMNLLFCIYVNPRFTSCLLDLF